MTSAVGYRSSQPQLHQQALHEDTVLPSKMNVNFATWSHNYFMHPFNRHQGATFHQRKVEEAKTWIYAKKDDGKVLSQQATSCPRSAKCKWYSSKNGKHLNWATCSTSKFAACQHGASNLHLSYRRQCKNMHWPGRYRWEIDRFDTSPFFTPCSLPEAPLKPEPPLGLSHN